MDSMSMSMAMDATTSSAMPMATGMDSMGDMGSMGDMSGHMSGTMDMSQMRMIFFDAANTPLFSADWTPTTTGQYAGTCIFLIILAVIMRVLLAYKTIFERQTRARALRRRYIVTAEPSRPSSSSEESGTGGTATLTAKGLTEKVRIIQGTKSVPEGSAARPWRLSTDLPRAVLVTVIVGVGYLLMLAVMTMNIGYFCSVLAGAFLGELFFGRFTVGHDADHSH